MVDSERLIERQRLKRRTRLWQGLFLVAMALGGVVMLVTTFVDYRHVERFAPLIFVATLALLALTLAVGVVTRGAPMR